MIEVGAASMKDNQLLGDEEIQKCKNSKTDFILPLLILLLSGHAPVVPAYLFANFVLCCCQNSNIVTGLKLLTTVGRHGYIAYNLHGLIVTQYPL